MNRSQDHKKAGAAKKVSDKTNLEGKSSLTGGNERKVEGARRTKPRKHSGSDGGSGQGNFSNH